VIAISHNREDPGAGIPAAISSEGSIGSKECLLHDILGPRRHPDEENAGNCGLLELRNDVPLKSGKAMDAYSRIELAPKDQHGVCVTQDHIGRPIIFRRIREAATRMASHCARF
jgi:hypothetical protein